MSTFTAGQKVTAALLEKLIPQYVEKGSDETVTSNATVQNDDELFLVLAPGTWEITSQLWLAGASGSNQDFKCGFTFPTGVLTWAGWGYHVNWANADGSRDMNAEGDVLDSSSPTNGRGFGTVTGTNVPMLIKAILTNSASGTLQLQWAQNTSNATGTTLKAGSWMSARRAVVT